MRSIVFCFAIWLATSVAVATTLAAESVASTTGPLAPAAALAAFHLAPGLEVSLVASEPEVIDPVAIRFDARGRLWVVEMRDYPGPSKWSTPNKEPSDAAQDLVDKVLVDREAGLPASRIRILEDRDHDGRFETAHLFAEHLEFPTGLQPWRDGVLVSLAGQIEYLKDTNHDGRADHHETWFTGFSEQNTQLRANHPTLGLDGFVYVANGLRGGQVKSQLAANHDPLNLRGYDFCFNPMTGNFHGVTGQSQFGMTLDNACNRFLCSNRNPLIHVVLENHYLGRNPLYAASAMVHDVARAGADSRVFPISQAWTTSNLHAGQFTAACGVTIYRGNRLPAEMAGNAFTCEPTGNLVHREILEPHGATFRSQPAREGVEFLASADTWFRPVDLTVGPDGALYVVDMYRAVIEHPDWVPEELRNRPDQRDGDNRGRIWRIAAKGEETGSVKNLHSLDQASSGQLVESLDHANAWWRETAAQLLWEQCDESSGSHPHDRALVKKGLQKVATTCPRPAARIAAHHVLANLKMLTPADVKKALADDHPEVRQQAIVLAEPWLRQSQAVHSASMRSYILPLANDPNPRVRFQMALSLAPMSGPKEISALRQIGLTGSHDPWTRDAVGIAAGDGFDLLVALLEQPGWYQKSIEPGELALLRSLAQMVGNANRGVQALPVLRVVTHLSASQQATRLQWVVVDGLTNGLKGQGQSLAQRLALPENEGLRERLRTTLEEAERTAAQTTAEPTLRVEAIRLLGQMQHGLSLLTRLAADEPNQSVRLQAIGALAAHPNLQPWHDFIEQFASQTPAIRRAVLDGLLARPDRTALLLDALDAGTIRAGEIGRVRSQRLLKNPAPKLRARAQQLLGNAIPEDRAKVLANYQSILQLPADPHRGKDVFQKQCTTCHRIAGLGVRVGPDIGDTRVKTAAQLLTDILQPNRAIDSNYMGYTVLMDSGRSYTGLLLAESAGSLTLQQEENKTVTLAKDQVEEIQASGLSLMPVGLEKNISHQQMADLISFLKNWRYLDGLTPAEGFIENP
ncbi:MAG: PVC-type heme-binding CxxCH protein [Pirellulales bacterium]